MFTAAVRADPRAWALVALTFVGLSLVFSARSALGLMIPTWEQELGWGRTFVSTGGSVVLVMMALVSPLAGNLLDRVGPRPVYVVALAFVATAIVATSLMTETWHFIVLFCILGGIGLVFVFTPGACLLLLGAAFVLRLRRHEDGLHHNQMLAFFEFGFTFGRIVAHLSGALLFQY